MWPDITVGIITYQRLEEIIETFDSLLTQVYYDGKIHWMISDDSSGDKYKNAVKQAIPEATYISTPRNMGWGANANNLRKNIKTEYLFMIEDDYILKKPLDMNEAISVMESKRDIGMMRFRGTAGEHIVFHQFEAATGLKTRRGYGLEGKVSYLQLDSGSPSLYLYSNGPHLVHRRFIDFYGAYPEGRRLGETEEAYAHLVKDNMKRAGAPSIVILPEWVDMWFDHIGKSYQHTEADRVHQS